MRNKSLTTHKPNMLPVAVETEPLKIPGFHNLLDMGNFGLAYHSNKVEC